MTKYLCLDFYIKSLKALTDAFILPDIIEVSFGKAPSHDENHWTSCSEVKRECISVNTSAAAVLHGSLT